MDGLLVDSEPWWRVAERNVFGRLSVAPEEEDFEKMMGNRIQEVIANWHAKHPWPNFNLETTLNEIVDEVGRLVTENAQLMPGVIDTLEFFKVKKLPVALASSSPLRLINRLITFYGIDTYFVIVRSAEFEQRGKPHPDVFLTTAKALNIEPEFCLVFEDSHNGVLAAKAAGMKCVAVPAPEHLPQERFGIADLKLGSLTAFNESHFSTLNHGETRFDLTVRREDVLALYEDLLEFKLFSKVNYARIVYALMFFAGAMVNLFNFWNLENNMLWFALALGGCVWYSFDIYKDYATFKESKQKIYKWIDVFSRFKEHWLMVNENDFTYHRDTEIYRYDLTRIERKHHDERFFQLFIQKGERLTIPSKAFAPGKYDEFIVMLDGLIAKANKV